MKHVVVVSEFAGPGGPYFVLLRLVKFLLAEGHVVTVVPYDSRHPDLDALSQDNPQLVIAPRPSHGRRGTPLFRPLVYLKEAIQVRRWIRGQQTPADVVIFSVTSPGRFLFPARMAKKTLYLLHSTPTGLFHRLAGPYFRSLLPRGATIVSVSQDLGNHMTKIWRMSKTDSRLHVLRNTTGLPVPRSAVPVGSQTVLMVGRVSPEKCPLLWVDVASIVISQTSDAVKFVWLGDGPLRTACLQRVSERGLEGRISFPGFVENPEEAYQTAILYLHLATRDSMPLAAIDALRFGLPVVVSSAGGLPEVLEGNHNGLLLESYDSEHIGSQVTDMLSGGKQLGKMGQESSRVYAARFSPMVWESTLRELL